MLIVIVYVPMSQVRCQVQELRVVLLQEGSAAEDDIPEVQLQLGRAAPELHLGELEADRLRGKKKYLKIKS